MSGKAKKGLLPKAFKRYFWDVDFNKLSLQKHFSFILSRIMSFGDLTALKWLLKMPSKKVLTVARTSRDLDPKTRNFWQVVYGKKYSS
jgi:hypothetical protein